MTVSRRWQAFWLMIGSLTCLALLPVGAGLALMSSLVFYAQGSFDRPAAWLAFLFAVGLWVVCILGPFGAWVAFSRGQTRRAWLAMASPAAWGLAATGSLWLALG